MCGPTSIRYAGEGGFSLALESGTNRIALPPAAARVTPESCIVEIEAWTDPEGEVTGLSYELEISGLRFEVEP